MHWRRKWQPTPVFLPGESQGREAWWAAVYGVAQSWTRLKRLSSSSSGSVVLWEGGMLQTNNTGMCSQCLGHTRFAPAYGICAFPVYTASALGCSAGNCLRPALGCMHIPGLSRSGSGTRVLLKSADSVGPAFCALPRSKNLR